MSSALTINQSKACGLERERLRAPDQTAKKLGGSAPRRTGDIEQDRHGSDPMVTLADIGYKSQDEPSALKAEHPGRRTNPSGMKDRADPSC
jgi:hypothetical protein